MLLIYQLTDLQIATSIHYFVFIKQFPSLKRSIKHFPSLKRLDAGFLFYSHLIKGSAAELHCLQYLHLTYYT